MSEADYARDYLDREVEGSTGARWVLRSPQEEARRVVARDALGIRPAEEARLLADDAVAAWVAVEGADEADPLDAFGADDAVHAALTPYTEGGLVRERATRDVLRALRAWRDEHRAHLAGGGARP